MLVYSEVAHRVQHVLHFVLGSDIIFEEEEENLCAFFIFTKRWNISCALNSIWFKLQSVTNETCCYL